MLIRRPEHAPAQAMLLPGAAGVTMRVVVGREDGAPTFAMRHFELAPSGCTPRHQHNYEHEVIILEGEGVVVDGAQQEKDRPVRSGDVLLIPANEIHQFRNTGPRPLKFMCLVPTHFDCGNGACQPTPGS